MTMNWVFFLFYPLKDIFLFTGNFSNLVLCIAIKIQQFKIKRSWFASWLWIKAIIEIIPIELHWSFASSLLRHSWSHFKFSYLRAKNFMRKYLLGGEPIVFPTLITWGHLWKSRCFQRPCTSYLRFQKVSVNIVRHFPWGFSITIKSGKVNFWLCLAGSKIHKDMSNIRKIPKKKCLISHSDWFHFQSDCGKLNLLADNKSQLYLQQTKVNDLLFLNKT